MKINGIDIFFMTFQEKKQALVDILVEGDISEAQLADVLMDGTGDYEWNLIFLRTLRDDMDKALLEEAGR